MGGRPKHQFSNDLVRGHLFGQTCKGETDHGASGCIYTGLRSPSCDACGFKEFVALGIEVDRSLLQRLSFDLAGLHLGDFRRRLLYWRDRLGCGGRFDDRRRFDSVGAGAGATTGCVRGAFLGGGRRRPVLFRFASRAARPSIGSFMDISLHEVGNLGHCFRNGLQ